MSHYWQVFLHYYPIVAAVLVTSLIPSLINALTKYPKAAGVVKWLSVALDIISITTKIDSPGTLKPLIKLSKNPNPPMEVPNA